MYVSVVHIIDYVNLERLVTNFITYYSVQTLQVKEKNLIPKYFFNRPNALKLSSLFNKKKPETIRKLCKLIDIINKKISSP